jgi:hypothetical protein
MSESGEGKAFGLWWPWPGSAQILQQPILPQWSFGNITINQRNSSAPETEMEILAENSYGRQLGKLIDAVAVLVRDRPRGERPEALEELLKLQSRIEEIKTNSATRRLQQVREDLERLKVKNRKAFEIEVAAFRKLMAR